MQIFSLTWYKVTFQINNDCNQAMPGIIVNLVFYEPENVVNLFLFFYKFLRHVLIKFVLMKKVYSYKKVYS